MKTQPADPPPVLRGDLSLRAGVDGRGCQVRDPVSGKTYEFGAVEAFLLDGLRGAWNAADLARACNERHGAQCAPDDIESFVRMVDGWGLLQRTAAPAPESGTPAAPDGPAGGETGVRWVVREAVALDMLGSAARPFAFLEWVIPPLLCFGVVGIGARWREFLADLAGVPGNPAALAALLPGIVLTAVIVAAWRGAAVAASGAGIPAVGLRRGWRAGLVVESPGEQHLDARARFRIAIAPLQAAATVAGLAAILWIVATRAHNPALAGVWAVLVVTGASALVASAAPALRRCRGGGVAEDSPAALALCLVAFGAAAASLTLAYVQLESRVLGGGLIAVFLAAAGLAFAMKTPSAHSALERHRARTAGGPSAQPAPKTATAGGGLAARRRRIKIGLVAAFVVCLFLPYPFHVGGEAEVLPAQRTILTAEMDGMIEEIFFDSGDFVEAGTTVAQMANHKQIRDLRTSEAERDSILFEIARLRSTPTPEEVAAATAKVDSAAVAARYTADELKRATLLYERGSSSTQELDKARQAADAAVQGLAEAEANLAAVKAQVNPNQIAALEAEKVKMDHEVELGKEQLRRTSLVTPISGRIVTKDLKYKLKSFVKEGVEFAVVEDLQTVLIQVAVPEPEIGDVQVGAAMKLRLWAYPDEEFEGHVEQILPAAEETSADMGRTVPVLGRMDNADGRLRSGLTGQAKIRGEPRLVIVAFTKAVVRFVLVELWSWFP